MDLLSQAPFSLFPRHVAQKKSHPLCEIELFTCYVSSDVFVSLENLELKKMCLIYD